VRALGGLDLDREQAVGGVEDEIDFAPGVRAEEVKGRGLRLSGRPAEQLVEDGGFKERADARAGLVAQEAGQCRNTCNHAASFQGRSA
jgi:hypothetical protein